MVLALPVRADWKDQIGFTALQERLGAKVPTGHTIQIAQVEMPADEDGDYLPDRSDSQLIGKTITSRSGAGGVSSHATIVGQYLTGSVGPGIRRIDSYEANNWAGPGMLMISTFQPPQVETRPVQNHSWIGTYGSDCTDTEALRRLDLMIERDGVVVVAGVKNGAGTPVPHLMCSAYNAIAVGVSSGKSSYGPTSVDTDGRVKPDIVAPMNATSWATPVVSSSASLLLEAIEAHGDWREVAASDRKSARPLIVKAMLMAGAVKTPWGDWRRGHASACRDGSVPLDHRYGAGQLNIDNSYRIVEAGRQNAGDLIESAGWDYARARADRPQRYPLRVAGGASEASFLLTWMRHVKFDAQTAGLESTMSNLDLRLVRVTDAGGEEAIDISRSRVDNVEHIYVPKLARGRYVVEVSTDCPASYALAWHMKTPSSRVAPTGPSMLAGGVEIDDAD